MSPRKYGDTPWWEHLLITLAVLLVPAMILVSAIFAPGGGR